jgi:hypothetical protein
LSGSGVREVYGQFENELREIRGELEPESKNPGEWEPPSLERIRKRMTVQSMQVSHNFEL